MNTSETKIYVTKKGMIRVYVPGFLLSLFLFGVISPLTGITFIVLLLLILIYTSLLLIMFYSDLQPQITLKENGIWIRSLTPEFIHWKYITDVNFNTAEQYLEITCKNNPVKRWKYNIPNLDLYDSYFRNKDLYTISIEHLTISQEVLMRKIQIYVKSIRVD